MANAALATLMIEGMPPGDFIEASIKSSGYKRDEWFRRFNEATGLNAKDDGTAGDTFKKWLDGKYAQGKANKASNDGYGDLTGPHGVYQDMHALNRNGSSKGHRFLYDETWQYKTTTVFSYVDEKGEKHRDYVDVAKGHFLARHLNEHGKARDGGEIGDIYRIWDPDHPENGETYAMLADGSPLKVKDDITGKKVDGDTSRTEVSEPVLHSVNINGMDPVTGMPDPVTGRPGGGAAPHLLCERLGRNTLPKAPGSESRPARMPTDEEILEQGRELSRFRRLGLDYTPSSPGTFRLETGDLTVLLGPVHHPAGIADPSCTHTGKGYLNGGSQTVFVSPKLCPFGRVGDPTSDGFEVKNGLETVDVFGQTLLLDASTAQIDPQLGRKDAPLQRGRHR